MFHQLLAQHGVIVWVLDNRSAERQGRGVAVAGLRQARRAGAADLEDGIAWLKQQPYVDRVAHRAPRLELRRLHDGVRADAQHELGGRHRRRAGDRLAQLRHGLHRALHEDAAEQPRRLPATRRRGSPPTSLHGRLLLMHGTHRRQRAHAELGAVRLRAAARRQAVRDDDLSAVSGTAFTDPRLNKHLRQLMFDFIDADGRQRRRGRRDRARRAERVSFLDALHVGTSGDRGGAAAAARRARIRAKAWTRGSTCITPSARSRARTSRVFLTDSAVGTQEENNLRHLVTTSDATCRASASCRS